MISEVQTLLDNHWKWLREKTTLRAMDRYVEITTPFLDRHNDCIQIYARREKSGYLLTDDGNTITDLEQTGCNLDSRKRKELLNVTLNGFGVQLKDKCLEVRATQENLGQRKHNLVQAILAVNDMFYLATPITASLFHEDVIDWLNMHDIRYTPNVKFTGKSAYDHVFDFVIPKSRKEPERIIKAINKPNRDSAQVVAFSWHDTKNVRSGDSKAFALLNDSEHEVPGSVLDALTTYELKPVLWSRREEVAQELAA